MQPHLAVGRHGIVVPRHKGTCPLAGVEGSKHKPSGGGLRYKLGLAVQSVVLQFVPCRGLYQQIFGVLGGKRPYRCRVYGLLYSLHSCMVWLIVYVLSLVHPIFGVIQTGVSRGGLYFFLNTDFSDFTDFIASKAKLQFNRNNPYSFIIEYRLF